MWFTEGFWDRLNPSEAPLDSVLLGANVTSLQFFYPNSSHYQRDLPLSITYFFENLMVFPLEYL